ncbi:MAG TPA: response regulator [Bryobacteraceae bacterium]|nr:response regulator [Bryobacteraceae bacterium]HPT25423.1 response regulator [Bryobacteraceae bacterium]
MARATILLVEDEAPLRNLLGRYLERQGYVVIASGDGTEALDAFTDADGAIDVAIVDLTLPGLSGEMVVTRLLDASPSIRVIVSSGRPYSTEALPEPYRPRAEALLKPYLPQSLLDSIARLLGDEAQPSMS